MKVVFASHNSGKIKEVSELLSATNIQILSCTDLNFDQVSETAKTFVENALLKARYVSGVTNLPALADDSGLVVDYLNGAPGIYSSRYASEHATDQENIEQLLTALKDIPQHKRVAKFYCALVLLKHEDDPTPIICTGELAGEILTAPQGQYGFGYDPIFYVPTMHKTLAELPLEVKNKISHRAQALQKLMKKISGSL